MQIAKCSETTSSHFLNSCILWYKIECVYFVSGPRAACAACRSNVSLNLFSQAVVVECIVGLRLFSHHVHSFVYIFFCF